MACTPVGIAVPDDLPIERWEAALRLLAPAYKGAQWAIGDLLVHGGKRYGDTYNAAAEATGLAVSTLKNLKWVAGKWPPDLRHADVSWAKHRDLATLPEHERAERIAGGGDDENPSPS